MKRLSQVEHNSKKKCVSKLEFSSRTEVIKNRPLVNEDGRLCTGSGSPPTRGFRPRVKQPLSPDAWRPVPSPLQGRGQRAGNRTATGDTCLSPPGM